MLHRAGPQHLDHVADLIAAFRDWWGKEHPGAEPIRATVARLLDDPQTEFFVAYDDDTPAGVIQLRYRLSVWTGFEDCWLEDLFVIERARGGGHGRALVEAAFDSARVRGCKRIELDVNEQNTAAIGFYESLGFTTEPKPPGRTLFISRSL